MKVNKKILVINAGSSSIKFKVYDYQTLNELASGLCERIFVDGFIKVKVVGEARTYEKNIAMPNHTVAVKIALDALKTLKVIDNFKEIAGVGHRIAMGGNFFKDSALLTKPKLDKAEDYGKLAPLHNPAETAVIKVFAKLIPGIKNVGVFDTSFHATIPEFNSDYTLDRKTTAKYEIKKYGFHGTSYRFITKKMESLLKKKNPNLVICHIGNGASICAVKAGKSFDTTMGISPLQGLVMGTRCGDIDASVATYLMTQGMNAAKVSDELNKKAGLKGLCGSSDTRDMLAMIEKGNKAAKLAREIQIKRIANYVVNYINQLENKVDAIVFTAGCGENDPELLEGVCDNIFVTNLKYDTKKNHKKYSDFINVSGRNSAIKIFKVRTNEELMIAQDTKRLAK